LVLYIHGNIVCGSYSCGNNKVQRKIEFQNARFADIVVLRSSRVDNIESYRQADQQVLVADICDSALFLFEDISCGKKQTDIWSVRFGFCYNRISRGCLGVEVAFTASQHHLFKITGSFFNPGPYSGWLAMVFPMALGYAVLNYFNHKEHEVAQSLFDRISTGLLTWRKLKCRSLTSFLPNSLNTTTSVTAMQHT
jgi:hypothetical protein